MQRKSAKRKQAIKERKVGHVPMMHVMTWSG
jgi:hypothetical protein